MNLVSDFQALSEDQVDQLYIRDRAEIFAALPGHYSELGNKFVAEWMYAKLRGLLPADASRLASEITFTSVNDGAVKP